LNLNGFIKIGKDSEYKFVHFLFAQVAGNYLFISFAPPKETNQRKGGPKCQLQPKRAPATQAFMRYRFG